jgi:hypothetical protein
VPLVGADEERVVRDDEAAHALRVQSGERHGERAAVVVPDQAHRIVDAQRGDPLREE